VGKMANGMCTVTETEWEREFSFCAYIEHGSLHVLYYRKLLACFCDNFFIVWQMYLHFKNDHNCGNVNF